jgi:hypothetical protein
MVMTMVFFPPNFVIKKMDNFFHQKTLAKLVEFTLKAFFLPPLFLEKKTFSTQYFSNTLSSLIRKLEKKGLIKIGRH